MSLLNFRKSHERREPRHDPNGHLAQFLKGASIEVMPRTATKIEDFSEILPEGTKVFIAHIAGVPIEDMITCAARLRGEGMEPVPHFVARNVPNLATLEDWIARYQGEADVRQGLVLAGGLGESEGNFDSSMQLLDTGLFDKAGFTHLNIAGHPEGNKDIDPDGSDTSVMNALRWKADFQNRSDAEMALVTQFCFDAQPMIDWARRLKTDGITFPIHAGLAGPAKLQTLIKFAIACGVGPSLKVLQKRALDVTKLVAPYAPDEVALALADHKAQTPDSLIQGAHIFPLGGISASAEWARDNTADAQADI